MPYGGLRQAEPRCSRHIRSHQGGLNDQLTATVRQDRGSDRRDGPAQQARPTSKLCRREDHSAQFMGPIVRLASSAAIAQNCRSHSQPANNEPKSRESFHADSHCRRFVDLARIGAGHVRTGAGRQGCEQRRRASRRHSRFHWRPAARLPQRRYGVAAGDDGCPPPEPLPPCPPCSLHDQPELLAKVWTRSAWRC